MLDLILPLVLRFLPYILLVVGAITVYFGIKHRGVVQERKKWEEAQARFRDKVNKRLAEAESKDSDIDKRVKEKVDEIKEAAKPIDPSDPSRFRF